jgi:hypothetical protein
MWVEIWASLDCEAVCEGEEEAGDDDDEEAEVWGVRRV